MDVERYLPLAPRDLLILSVLGEAPLHGYGIIKAVEERSRSGVLLDPANLYRVLRRMRKAGWIREDVSAETPEKGGEGDPRRKTYRITTIGRSILAAEVARLERLLSSTRPALADGDRA
jgi:DNA-binding PadR family transcriptional regulator